MKYVQTDSRWGGLGYPKAPYYIRNCGCGECAIANIIIETDKYANATPATIQPYCKQYADPKGNGTYWSGIPAMLKHYGLTDVKEHATMTPLWNELAKGNRVAVYLMGSRLAGSKKVRWTSSGHFVCSTGYKYENGKHYVYVKDSYSNSNLRNGWISYEENMKGDILKVWSAVLPAKAKPYTPTTPYTGKLPSKTVRKGSKGADVKHLQNFLNWCMKPSPKLAVDGTAGSKTINVLKKWQKQYKLQKVDGVFGSASRKKAQEIIKAHAPKPTPKPTPTVTGADKIVAKAKDYAWPYATEKRKYAYKTGAPKSAYKTALKKYMKKTAKVSQSDCGYFVSTCVRASGVAPKFLALAGLKDPFPNVPSTMKVVHKGKKIPDGLLKAGDVIRYKKTNGHQHAIMYMGGGKIADAGRSHWFPVIKKDTKKYNNSNVKLSTLQVIRAK